MRIKPHPHALITNIFKKNHYSEDIITSPKFMKALEEYNKNPPNFNREEIRNAFQETKDAYKDTYIFGKLAFMIVAWFIGVKPIDYLNVDAITDKYISHLTKRYDQFKKLEVDVKLQTAIMLGDNAKVNEIVQENNIDTNKYDVYLFDLQRMTRSHPPKYKAKIDELTNYWQIDHKSSPKRLIVAKELGYEGEIMNKLKKDIPKKDHNTTREDLQKRKEQKFTTLVKKEQNPARALT